ncbi:hypothetical protein I302_102660 [Kwoniella bestiolae CBS 10118]|uniref:Uncharacterized protein n=1 Tax=Kwoniella bestiolae CBS 10118 TaxID=1296100 RepID=A0A1B9GFL7_9TREE|nr:hypothetical protein I302_01353 [Kwoniella bestiolae CBS 10118]OCF29840.1 hypothetical protein I302_01353 [Kwoniella bestiolae CBS 10118]
MPSFLQYHDQTSDEMNSVEYDGPGYGTVVRLVSIRNDEACQREIDMKFHTILNSQTGQTFQRGVELVVPLQIEESHPDMESWVGWAMIYGAHDINGNQASVYNFVEDTFGWLSEADKMGMLNDARHSLGHLYRTKVGPSYRFDDYGRDVGAEVDQS